MTLTGSYRQFYDNRFLSADDLPSGKDIKVTIEAVTKEEIKDPKSKDKTVLALRFVGKTKFFAVNKTNANSIKKDIGLSDVSDWVGKEITIYATTCNAFGDPNTPCIRVRAPKKYRVKSHAST